MAAISRRLTAKESVEEVKNKRSESSLYQSRHIVGVVTDGASIMAESG